MDDIPIYRIKDWHTHFENSAHKSPKGPLRWIAMPTKQDGRGRRRLIRMENGPAMFGAWCAIVQVAATCPIRGTLARDDGPLTAIDIQDITDMPQELISDTLAAISDPANGIGWIQMISSGDPAYPDVIAEIDEISGNIQTHPDSSGRFQKHPAYKTRQDRTGQDTTQQGAAVAAVGGGGGKILKAVGINGRTAKDLASKVTGGQVIAAWAAVKAIGPTVKNAPGLIVAKLRDDPPRLAREDVAEAVAAGLVKSVTIGGKTTDLTAGKITHNAKGIYVAGDLVISADELVKGVYQ